MIDKLINLMIGLTSIWVLLRIWVLSSVQLTCDWVISCMTPLVTSPLLLLLQYHDFIIVLGENKFSQRQIFSYGIILYVGMRQVYSTPRYSDMLSFFNYNMTMNPYAV